MFHFLFQLSSEAILFRLRVLLFVISIHQFSRDLLSFLVAFYLIWWQIYLCVILFQTSYLFILLVIIELLFF